nr:pitrilysin family protein [Fertoeibacter niger]
MIRLALALILFALPLRAEIAIKEVVSPGGITAWLVEEHGIPFTALEIRFKGGTSLDAPGKRGAVNLMTGLIEEGAGDLDAQGFAAARDGLAASYRFRAGIDSLSVSAQFLTENRDQAVDLLRLALVEPRFDADAVERVRGQVLSGLRSDAKDPAVLAANAFDAAAFGDHPYGSSGDGTLESVAALTRDDIIAANTGALARDRIYVSAVGDITAEDLGALLDHLLGDLPATGAPMPGRAGWALAGGVTVQDFPTPQSVIRFGHEGITRDDPDFFAAYILNEVLGGGRFGARLMTEVREKRGLTYGVSTYLAPMDHAEMFLGQFASANEKAAEAVAVVQAEWARMAAEGITAEELASTKTFLTGSYPLRFDGNGPIADILVGMQMQGLPIDYAATRNEKIEAVTLDDVARVAKRLLRPDDLHFVVVGQPVGLASDG